MPSALRAKVALVGLFSVLLIPVYTSSLRGLTHVLSCSEVTDTDFSIRVDEEGVPSILSSIALDRDDIDRSVCGGLTVDVSIGSFEPGRAEVVFAVTNETEHDWIGSMKLQLDDTPIPIRVGHIDAESTASEAVEVRLDDGRAYEIGGSLLIGP